MTSFFHFIRWPIVCGLLSAIFILDYVPRILPDHPLVLKYLTPPQSEPAHPIHSPYSYAEAVQKAAPAVVNIYTTKIVKEKLPAYLNDPLFRYFFGQYNVQPKEKEKIERSLGSGVIISPEGYLLTNNHVIDGADEIVVLLLDGREALATVTGTDPDSDLAVLKIDLPDLNTITIGDPSAAQVGDVVLAIGNPYGFGQTVTQGIISAAGRYGLGLSRYEDYLQTDAAINFGNSGGALVDAEGKLLGINTAIYNNSEGIGLATPADLALQIMSDLVMHGRVIRGWLGIEATALSPELAAANGLPNGNAIIITQTTPSGPADQAGIIAGDIITGIADRPVGDGHAAMNLIATIRPGVTTPIDIMRNGSPLRINTAIGSQPETSKQ
jgi:serine protease DegS